jgi:hypothetical protein
VRTPSGGLHVWYRTTGNRQWLSSVGSTPGRALAWQVDIRAHGSYIVAPGTTTTHGTYTPVGEAREPAALPLWLAQELDRTGHLPAPSIPAPRPVPPRAQQAVLAAGGGRQEAGHILATLLAPVEACGQVAEGAGFSDTLNRAAYTLGGLIAAGRLPEEAEHTLKDTAAAARPGQDLRIQQIIRSGPKNGKSVLLDVTMKLLGDYADAAPPGFLMAKPFEGHPTDLAELHGRRIYVCSEIKPGDKFDEARVKLLTGGDRIKARRMRLLPFERIVPDDRKIDNLADILVTEEGPGILSWLIDGARRYLAGARDLTGPERVRIATTAYAETEDHTGRFYYECCRLGPDLRAEQTALYAAYKAWCHNEGALVMSPRVFAARTRELVGLASPKERILSNQRKHYPGIGLLTDDERDTSQ